MNRRCQVCGQRYGAVDAARGPRPYAYDWHPSAEAPWRRCYACWWDMLVSIFGPGREPTIELNGVKYGADWSAPVEGGGVNIPF